ncbi:hypothetical protein O1W71_16255 [Microbacterium sp. H37-C3]|uniref:hypothetical protein n=1 Tax=Microbacterium sp. H37-C3 TaxID=3004354 RepID=UPI0022AEEAAC|nr:hypothetical protein [Microbacterium sp. H37-C3]MCZ4069225.1 hypothetical protein [Microbacterium sp. H37-C3]
MADWHAMLAAVEDPPGTWTMVAPDGREYGTVQIVRRGGEIAYRVTALGRHAGWTSTLRSACERIHHAFIASHSPGPPPGGIYPDLNGILNAGNV